MLKGRKKMYEELKRGGKGRNNHRRHFSFYVFLLWKERKCFCGESTPDYMPIYKTNQEN